MEELVQQLLDKAGLTPEQAQKAATVAINFLKSKVPPAMQGNIDSFLNNKNSSGNDSATDPADMTNKAKDIFGQL